MGEARKKRPPPLPPLPPSAWATFLEARLALIAEWTDERRTVQEIVRDLSVDHEQVRLLQMTIAERTGGPRTRRWGRQSEPSEKG